IKRAMVLVGSGFGDQRDIGAGAAACIGAAIGGGNAELLHRVGRHPQNAGKGGAVGFRKHIRAIQRNIGLVAPAAVDGAAAVVQASRTERTEAGDSRLQGQQARPGWRASRPATLRAYMGSSVIAWVVITLPMEESTVFSWVALASTEIVSVVAPIFSNFTATVAGSFTSN